MSSKEKLYSGLLLGVFRAIDSFCLNLNLNFFQIFYFQQKTFNYFLMINLFINHEISKTYSKTISLHKPQSLFHLLTHQYLKLLYGFLFQITLPKLKIQLSH